jgi:hypothetical protein
MFSYWAYILIGNNDSGKTTFQKRLAHLLCGKERDLPRLDSNVLWPIVHPRMPKGFVSMFLIGRSYQERLSDWGDVPSFFQTQFKEASICILSSHTDGACQGHIGEMLEHLRSRRYNVAGVFFSNAFNAAAKKIALLDWDERLWVDNPNVESNRFDEQISRRASEFVEMLVARSTHQ